MVAVRSLLPLWPGVGDNPDEQVGRGWWWRGARGGKARLASVQGVSAPGVSRGRDVTTKDTFVNIKGLNGVDSGSLSGTQHAGREGPVNAGGWREPVCSGEQSTASWSLTWAGDPRHLPAGLALELVGGRASL